MTEQFKNELAHKDYPYGSEAPYGSRDRALYERKKESFLNGIEAAIMVMRSCESDSEQYFCEHEEVGYSKRCKQQCSGCN